MELTSLELNITASNSVHADDTSSLVVDSKTIHLTLSNSETVELSLGSIAVHSMRSAAEPPMPVLLSEVPWALAIDPDPWLQLKVTPELHQCL